MTSADSLSNAAFDEDRDHTNQVTPGLFAGVVGYCWKFVKGFGVSRLNVDFVARELATARAAQLVSDSDCANRELQLELRCREARR